jgi:hypothetical protein
MNALVGIKKNTEVYLEKLLQQRKMAKPTAGAATAPPAVVLSAADIQKQLKAIWCQLVRALVLQNISGIKSVGTVAFGTTESSPRAKLALNAIVHEEISDTMSVRANQGESLRDYTIRLQTRDRFIKWTISMLLREAEETQSLQLADIQFFKVLKAALPDNWAYMGEVALAGGFPMLCSKIMEVCSDLSSGPTTPTKKAAFVALGGKLSRQPGARVVGEKRTEQHNKTVVTEYLPREEPTQSPDEEEGSEEEDQREVISRIKNLEAALEARGDQKATSRTKPYSSPDKAEDKGGKRKEEPITSVTETLVSLMKEIRDQGRAPVKGECYAFSREGTCIRGDKCGFEHRTSAVDAPPAYPSPAKARTPGVAHRINVPCRDYARGNCKWGSTCGFQHTRQSPSKAQAQPSERRHENPRCVVAIKRGHCSDKHCFEQHGRFDDKSMRLCDFVREGKPCRFMWTQDGCLRNHKEESTRKEKNEAGSGRAEKRLRR